MILFINEYGQVEEKESKYKVTLDSSYRWSSLSRAWEVGIKSIEPKIPLSKMIISDELFDKILPIKKK